MIYNKFLIGITTYGSAPYVDLSLSFLKKFDCNVVVLDDGSHSNKLLQVCNKHNVQLFGLSQPHENTPCLQDFRNTLYLVRLGNLLNCECVIKMSRRWICMQNPIPSLIQLIQQTNGNTFSNITTSYGFGFRTQFMALRVKDWMKVACQHETRLFNKKDFLFVEGYVHDLAKKIQPTNQQYLNYVKEKNFTSDKSGYVHWDWMGTDRRNVPEYIMWHDSHKPFDYYNKAKQLGLNYNLSDFEKLNG